MVQLNDIQEYRIEEELNESIREIAKNANNAASVTRWAVELQSLVGRFKI